MRGGNKCWVLSTELIREFDYSEEIRKLSFDRALALRQNEQIRPDEGLTLETSALESLLGGQITWFIWFKVGHV